MYFLLFICVLGSGLALMRPRHHMLTSPGRSLRGTAVHHMKHSGRIHDTSRIDSVATSISMLPTLQYELAKVSLDLRSEADSWVGDHILLVDFAVRNWADINRATPEDTSREVVSSLDNFMLKAKKAGITLQEDRLLHYEDIGQHEQSIFSIARIPPDMSTKMEISRKLAEIHSKHNVTVHMVGLNSEYFMDAAMCEAVLSAFQLHHATMPSFKTSPIKPGRTASAATAVPSLTFNVPKGMFDPSQEGTPEEIKLRRTLALAEAIEQASRDRFQKDAAAAQRGLHTAHASTSAGIDDLQKMLNLATLVNQGTHLSRSLTSLPPNVLTPGAYARYLHHLAQEHGWKTDEWSTEQLESIGCGAFCAVGRPDRAHPDRSARLVRLRWQPAPTTTSTTTTTTTTSATGASTTATTEDSGAVKGPNQGVVLGLGTMQNAEGRRPVVLVGKGVCYDTGGLNMKSAENMRHMKTDMAGSASALGTFLALSKSGFAHPLECWLALAENNVGSTAYRPDDVLTAVTGHTIECVHTDAEGRLLLVDTLALASRLVTPSLIYGRGGSGGGGGGDSSCGSGGSSGGDGEGADVRADGSGGGAQRAVVVDPPSILPPRLLVDLATLTGSCVTALSDRYMGVFSNGDYEQTIMDVGRQCGERAWPFPCDEDFYQALQKSDVADLLQCLPKNEADHIFAAALLKRFVKPTVPWVHIDLASAHRVGGLGCVSTDCTGAGVRFAVHLIHRLLEV